MSICREDARLAELFAVIADYLSAGDNDEPGYLVGRVRAWLEVAEGRVLASDSAGRLADGPAPIERAVVLVALVREYGVITTSMLARASCVCAETARLYLRGLAVRKVMRKISDKRGARYIAGVNFGDFALTVDRRFSDTCSSDEREGAELASLALPVGVTALSEVVA